MDEIKAAYLPHDMAFPPLYVIDPSIAGGEEGQKAAEACPYGAVDLSDTEKEITVNAPAVVWTTGWTPYDPTKLETYDYDNNPNMITNVMMERLAAVNGPTGGKIQRPGDGEVPANVAFIQCAGSRDENHLPFCSTICCLASLKQATYIREQNPESTVTIYYIDIRAMDRYEDFYTKVKEDENVKFVKSKIAKIYAAEGGNLTLEGEDTASGQKFKAEHDLVVLATGMQPNTSINQVPAPGVEYDDYGYMRPNPGIIGAGTVKCASNVATCVQESTGAALKAIQAARR
jgi:quinone-modifying oxidoreductase subunit QmoA